MHPRHRGDVVDGAIAIGDVARNDFDGPGCVKWPVPSFPGEAATPTGLPYHTPGDAPATAVTAAVAYHRPATRRPWR